MYRSLARLGLFFSMASLVPSVGAGQISPDLQEDLLSLKPGETVDAIVSLAVQYPVSAVDEELHRQRVPRKERHERVVSGLKELAAESQADLLQWLDAFSGSPDLKSLHPFWITNAVHVNGSRVLFELLAQRSDVGQINRNHPIENARPIITPVKPGDGQGRTMADGLAAINAPAVWALGYTGAGTLVCNIDTGVDGSHSALASRWRGLSEPAAECFFDPVNNTAFPYDSGAHGTHTMGTITGMSTVTGDTTGVAFGAQWICAATIDHPGGGGINGTIQLALQSFEWAVDPDGLPGTIDDVPDVISNSWGIPQGFLNQCDQTYWNAIDACEAAGSVVVFAAGNEGFSGLRSPSARATSTTSTFAVAAVDISNPGAPVVAGFSSRGPSACSADPVLQIKPEIAAPGVNTYSTVPGGGYENGWSGTSMATPHVAGVIALMRSANPDLDATTIKQIIMDTAVDIDAPGDDNNAGHGMIDALACVLAGINGYGSVSGTVTGNGQPITATVSVQGSPQSVTCDGNGHYTMGLPGDADYTLVFSRFGYITDAAVITLVGDGEVTRDMNLALAPSATLSGTVYDPDDAPFAGAVITFPGTPLEAVNTDGSGFYQTSLPLGATYTVHAAGTGIGSQTRSVFVDGNTTLDFNLPGDPMFFPSEPDSYGYRIFDSNDGPGAPVHVWQSIGAQGAQIFLSDDSQQIVDTTFPFTYYGTEYTTVGISSNGYITMGTGYTDYFNMPIPNPGFPNNSVYGVWDDLNPGAGGIVRAGYSAFHGGFVVEYSGVFYYGTSIPVSFQIVILDPALYPTPTGDAAFLIHYGSGERGSCTVGLENGTGTVGVLYVVDNTYSPTSSPLVSGDISLLMTTNPFGLGSAPEGLDAPEVHITYLHAGNRILLDWEDVTGADGYHVYSAPSAGGPWTWLATVANSAYTTHSIIGKRCYRVTAHGPDIP